MNESITEFNKVLNKLKIKATCVAYNKQGSYFYYDLQLKQGSRAREIEKFGDEISMALKTPGRPRLKVLHEQGVVRLEFATPRTSMLKLFDYFTNRNIPKGQINVLLGETVEGKRMWMDLAQNPHMLVAGTTGSGKSILLHNIIANLLNYNDVDLYLVDPKRIEFQDYLEKLQNIPVYNTYEEAVNLIEGMLEVMEDRYERMRRGTDASSIKPMVIIIDEFADLIMQDQDDVFYRALCRLAQKCRAARMHIILATQRPSVNIVNGVIKANFPARIACRVASHIDSKVILDSSGAENLLGKGDAMVRDTFRTNERFQVAYTDSSEVCAMFGQ